MLPGDPSASCQVTSRNSLCYGLCILDLPRVIVALYRSRLLAILSGSRNQYRNNDALAQFIFLLIYLHTQNITGTLTPIPLPLLQAFFPSTTKLFTARLSLTFTFTFTSKSKQSCPHTITLTTFPAIISACQFLPSSSSTRSSASAAVLCSTPSSDVVPFFFPYLS